MNYEHTVNMNYDYKLVVIDQDGDMATYSKDDIEEVHVTYRTGPERFLLWMIMQDRDTSLLGMYETLIEAEYWRDQVIGQVKKAGRSIVDLTVVEKENEKD